MTAAYSPSVRIRNSHVSRGLPTAAPASRWCTEAREHCRDRRRRAIFRTRLRRRSKEAVANAKSRKKRKAPKRVLALPDLEQAKSAVLNTLTSKSGQRTYDHAITEFVEWYCSEPRLAFNRTVVSCWTTSDTLRSVRNRAMLSLLIGCGLRRAELLGLTMNHIQLREEHWVIADLIGKGGHIRTVPIPLWVKKTVNSWTELGHITAGRVFRAINKAGRIWGDGMTPKVLWEVVKDTAARAGIEKLALMIFGVPARVCVILPAGNWIRSSSSWGMCPYKRLNDISAASRNRGLR